MCFTACSQQSQGYISTTSTKALRIGLSLAKPEPLVFECDCIWIGTYTVLLLLVTRFPATNLLFLLLSPLLLSCSVSVSSTPMLSFKGLKPALPSLSQVLVIHPPAKQPGAGDSWWHHWLLIHFWRHMMQPARSAAYSHLEPSRMLPWFSWWMKDRMNKSW